MGKVLMVNKNNWWQHLPPNKAKPLTEIWVPIGLPGFAGIEKAERREKLDQRFLPDGWRMAHVVRGQIVSKLEALKEYEAAYRHFLRANPPLVQFLTTTCGNVYDDNVTNVYDDEYEQPHTAMNHYQDISVRRVISELVDDSEWVDVMETDVEEAELTDLTDGQTHLVPRARGFRGSYLLQIREPISPGFFLNPAVVPIHDPTLITTLPNRQEWYHQEGCAHLSVEAFWQMSKVIEVRYDRFLALGDERMKPLSLT
jgi:hypothetical protein